MKRELSGGITSRKRFAGKSDFSAKQVSTTLLLLLFCLLIPSSVKAATINISFTYPGMAAYDKANGDDNCSANIVMSNQDYSSISGAKVGQQIDAKYKNTSTGNYNTLKPSVDISRLAFVVNTDGVGNAHNNGAGWYLRGRKNGNYWTYRGLYAGQDRTELAVMNLKPGDKVTFTFSGDADVASSTTGGLVNVSTLGAITSGQAVEFWSSGDLIVGAYKGTVINNIKIETADVAKYTISTSFNENTRKTISTFTFTQNGVLDDNDFTLPSLSASFGSINDYLVVQGENKEAHMFKTDGSETLENNGEDGQPSAGSFYSFKPTANGKITVYGTLSGSKIHIFDYYNTWQNCPGWPRFYKETFTDNSFSFNVESGHTYYLCINNIVNDYDGDERSYAYHLHSFTFETDFYVKDLGVVIDNVDNYSSEGTPIELTEVNPAGDYTLTVKRCTGNISNASSLTATISDSDGKLYMSKPTFTSGTDHAGTVIWNLKADGGDAAIVVTFPYHADFDNGSDPNRTSGHIWNFMDPRLSDSNIENCQDGNGNSVGELSGILSIGQDKDASSPFHAEVANREWTYAQRITGEAGGFHDPMYKNVWDMVGDNADMIWETEGLIFKTSPLLSCLYNEKNPLCDTAAGNPIDARGLRLFEDDGQTPAIQRDNNDNPILDEEGNQIPKYEDPDRYVGLMPIANEGEFSEFTIPGLKDGDRVLIYMRSGEGSSENGIFLNITGAKDALGKSISSSDLYKALGTNYLHDRYEGCYHFIKDGNGDMTFTLNGGSMCKIMYIRIYTGARVITNNIVAKNAAENDNSKLLLINEKGKAEGTEGDAPVLGSAGSTVQLSLRFTGKGQFCDNKVLTYSGNLNANSFINPYYVSSGKYNQFVDFTSKVGEFGMVRIRMTDNEHNGNYVADFIDKNITVGYRDKVDSYPYTWDFTDIQGFSSTSLAAEASNYPATSSTNYTSETTKHVKDGYEISLFDSDGYMKINSGVDPDGHNNIFDSHRIGFGNQLWAGSSVIPETRGLWFYTDDNDPNYNDCLQITSKGISFCNAPKVDDDNNDLHKPWWNYKMVVPDVPANAAVYLRMKRDSRIAETDKMYSDKDGKNVLFLNTRFHFGTTSSSNQKTSLTEDVDDEHNTIYRTQENGTNYSFYQVPGKDDEYILVVKNTTGATNHLTYTLNGWIVEKLAISEDAKTVNRLGWATESRARVIDPALTSEMTGYPFNTYIVTDASYANKTVTLTPVDVDNDVMPSAANWDNNAYIIQNTLLDEERKEGDIPAPGRVQILNNGFHLFVPDMHDYLAANVGKTDDEGHKLNQKSVSAMRDNMLVSLVTSQTLNKKGSDNIYNYALTSQKNKVGDADNQTYLDEIGFYRIADRTTSAANLAYLPVDCTVPTGTTDGGGAKMSIIFASIDEPVETVETAIEVPFEEIVGGSDAVYYNLNGQKLNGKPTKSGLYIMNGKKILVK